jgi:inner membrane protein
MDSLTQIALGGAVTALIAPARNRRAALATGAVLGTLPDLDIVSLSVSGVNPVDFVTWHRGPSHSLLVLGFAGWLLWLVLRWMWSPVKEAPRRWFWAIEAALLTHPLLDSFTVYGTQLFWPLPWRPVMWASIFIIDPAYTLPLLAACAAAWWLRGRPAATWWLLAGVCVSTSYLAWSLAAKALIERDAKRALAMQGLHDAPYFSAPMPFNTLLWRVVVMTPEGFLEGERSLVVDRGPMIFRAYPSDQAAMRAVAQFPAVRRLNWFTSGFLKAERRDDRLVLSDLRMGAEPDYIFRYVVAKNDAPGVWHRIPVERLSWPSQDRFRLAGLWHRIWKEPDRAGQGIEG